MQTSSTTEWWLRLQFAIYLCAEEMLQIYLSWSAKGTPLMLPTEAIANFPPATFLAAWGVKSCSKILICLKDFIKDTHSRNITGGDTINKGQDLGNGSNGSSEDSLQTKGLGQATASFGLLQQLGLELVLGALHISVSNRERPQAADGSLNNLVKKINFKFTLNYRSKQHSYLSSNIARSSNDGAEETAVRVADIEAGGSNNLILSSSTGCLCDGGGSTSIAPFHRGTGTSNAVEECIHNSILGVGHAGKIDQF